MMHMLMIFLVLLSLIFTIIWTLSQSKEKLQQTWSGIMAPFTSKTQDWATPLQAWAKVSLNKEKSLQSWLLALSTDGRQALGEKIADFCAEMNVDLTWLINPSTTPADAATEKQVAEEIVIDYCKICLKAVQHQAPTQ